MLQSPCNEESTRVRLPHLWSTQESAIGTLLGQTLELASASASDTKDCWDKPSSYRAPLQATPRLLSTAVLLKITRMCRLEVAKIMRPSGAQPALYSREVLGNVKHMTDVLQCRAPATLNCFRAVIPRGILTTFPISACHHLQTPADIDFGLLHLSRFIAP